MLPQVFDKIFLFFVLQMHFIACNSELSKVSNKTRMHRQRQKRTLYFTFFGGFALDVLLSFPLELPANNAAFCSFVFSANYHFRSFAYIDDEIGVNAGSKNRIELPPSYWRRQFNGVDQVENQTVSKNEKMKKEQRKTAKNKRSKKQTPSNKSRKVRSLLNNYFMSRRRFYKMMETKMDSSGLKGNDCLLKAICETAEASFGYHNGVIGSVVDILFLPSASKDEKLPKRYYRAETNGKSRNCAAYSKACPNSLFDFISKII